MNDAKFLKFLKTFNKEAKKISLKGNLIVSSYWLFVGLLIANSLFLDPPLYATMLYWIWLIIYQFKIIGPSRAVLIDLGEMSLAVYKSIDIEKHEYLKDSPELRKYSEFISHCINLSQKAKN